MSLITASHHPPLSLSPETTVLEACQKMKDNNVGAVAVIGNDNAPLGVFTERDAIQKILVAKRDPETTKLSDVMTSPCMTITQDRTITDALLLMIGNTIHHLALVDDAGKLIGMVSFRTLIREHVESLNAQVDHLSAYMGSDGIGGD